MRGSSSGVKVQGKATGLLKEPCNTLLLDFNEGRG
jgi:hypothetical protein